MTFSITEALRIGREANLPVQISHLKLGGQQNWGRTENLLGLIETARQSGQAVTIDQYPYTASSTSLSTLLPDAVQADGRDSLRVRLARPAVRRAYELLRVPADNGRGIQSSLTRLAGRHL